jgi:hypothetical protein
MRNALIVAAVVLLLRPAGAQEVTGSVVGLWLGENRTQEGLGNWLDFHGDGTVEIGFGALVGALLDDTYHLEGTTLTLRLFSGKTTAAGAPVFESSQRTVRIDGEHAVVESQWRDDQPRPETHSPEEQAMAERLRQPVSMTRVDPAPPGVSSIAGTWSYQHYTGQTAYETFTPGGKWYLRVPMQRQNGRYTVTPTEVIIKSAQQSDTFERSGDVLMTGPADGKHSTYRRAPR